jgi:hypothetical protein
MISGVLPVANTSAVNMDAILALLNFQLVPSLITSDANPQMVCSAFLSCLWQNIASSHFFMENLIFS